MGELAIRMVVSLAVVVGLLLLIARLANKRFQGRSDAVVQVLHRQSISRGSQVAVISVAGRVLVLGATEQQVRVLAELEPDEVAAHASAPAAERSAPVAEEPVELPIELPVELPVTRLAAVPMPAPTHALPTHALPTHALPTPVSAVETELASSTGAYADFAAALLHELTERPDAAPSVASPVSRPGKHARAVPADDLSAASALLALEDAATPVPVPVPVPVPAQAPVPAPAADLAPAALPALSPGELDQLAAMLGAVPASRRSRRRAAAAAAHA
ncbi:MAG: hypothetical protein F2667_09225, partial [Actinobacteria bacterium]|nr:hypothetical protein [Actinomycetota bacterium]